MSRGSLGIIPGRIPLNRDTILRPIGRVEIDIEICKGCGFCIEFCPNDVLDYSGRVNKQGYQYPIVKPGFEDKCVGCGMCERVCPDFAIRVMDQMYIPSIGGE